MDFIDLLLHTDDFLSAKVDANLTAAYVILFLIIFSESALIVCPFLPGDGLLFSAGVVAASTALNIWLVILLLILAAAIGYLVNYHFGRWVGVALLKKDIPLFHRYYHRTDIFINRYGIKAILISRFFPVFRTYIPFVAGVVRMDYPVFVRYTILGAVLWVMLFALTGFLMGEIPWVQRNYGLIFFGLILSTFIPFIYGFVRKRWRRK